MRHGPRISVRLVLCFLLGWQVAAVVAQPAAGRRSGFDDMGVATQAMQRDDSQNPAMLWAQDGAALWDRPAGRSNKACADCHGAAATGMRGVAARYPAFDPKNVKPGVPALLYRNTTTMLDVVLSRRQADNLLAIKDFALNIVNRPATRLAPDPTGRAALMPTGDQK